MINLKNLFKKEPKNYCIKVSNLSVNYGTKKILDNINFKVDNKDVFGIIGLSGSGKTTLLKALMKQTIHKGIIDYSSNKIGYCPQEDAFFHELSIKENIKLFGYLNSTNPDKALIRASKLMNELELKESIDKLSGDLSGGQRKRLNIILSILHEPHTIILDEPFAGLDYMNRIILWRFINHQRRRDRTIILTTHLLEEAQNYCNKLLIISKGKRFAIGSISDLKRNLKFRIYMRLKFNYLNKDNIERVKKYCINKGYKLLQIDENTASFGLPDNESRQLLIETIKRLNIKVNITEYRQPTLNEIFMVSMK